MLARISAAILLVLAVAAVWIMTHPAALPAPSALRAQDDSWSLPQRDAPDVAVLLDSIEKNKLWGANGLPAPQDEKPLTAPNWRITGVISAGRETYAVVEVEQQPTQQLKPGDKLPGGAKILSITADRICILLNGKKRALQTYKE